MKRMKWLNLVPPPHAMALLATAVFGVATATCADTVFEATANTAPPIVVQVCAACHGRDGNSVDPNVPSLAGQVAPYLERQLTAFQSQRRTGVMSGVAMGLSEADMRAAAAWFAKQTVQANRDPSPDSAALRQGAAIYLHGIADKHVPACASCHALRGGGLPPEFPRLAGQHAKYLEAQLRAFRSDSRLSNPNAMMRGVSARLSDSEIDAVAQYIADLP
jgi:cytochrome c553